MLDITTKIELDVMQVAEIGPAFEIALKHRMPAVVVHPQLVGAATMARMVKGCKFEIYTTVDWPKGEIFGVNKFRSIPSQALIADGFEILITGNKKPTESKNEMKGITAFIRDYVSPTSKIRFVLGYLTRPIGEVIAICEQLKDIVGPDCIRSDHHTKGQMNKFSTKAQQELVEQVSAVTGIRLKLSGNFDTVKSLQTVKAAKYALSHSQADKLIREFKKIAANPQLAVETAETAEAT